MELGRPIRTPQSLGGKVWIGPPFFSVHDVQQKLVGVVFHHVNFTTSGPASRNPRSPPGRPTSRTNVNAASHLEPAVQPGFKSNGADGSGSVLVCSHPFRLKDKNSIGAITIGPIQFGVANHGAAAVPFPHVADNRSAGPVEFIAPSKLPTAYGCTNTSVAEDNGNGTKFDKPNHKQS